MICHNLTIKYEYAISIATGVKTFEIRFNNRDYHVGDFICFTVIGTPVDDPYCILYYMSDHLYSISYITDYEQKEGYVVMSIKEHKI